jgi:hypothetical protein
VFCVPCALPVGVVPKPASNGPYMSLKSVEYPMVPGVQGRSSSIDTSGCRKRAEESETHMTAEPVPARFRELT